MFVADYSMKNYFFDRPRVVAAVVAAERRVLSRQGAFLRRRVRTDILRRTAREKKAPERGRDGRFKKAKHVSRAGQPPLVRSRDPVANLRNILFVYVPSRHSVLTGPVGLNKRLRGSSAQTVPELLEKGGTASVFQWAWRGSNVWNIGRAPAGVLADERQVRGRYSPHPFMEAGLQKEVAAGNIIGPWAGQVV